MGINWSELFPTKLSVFIFLGYMSLFVAQGILITASQEVNNSYNYNTVTVVLLTEVLKLIVSVMLYIRKYSKHFLSDKNSYFYFNLSNSIGSLCTNIRKDSNVMMLYFVPAFLYCFYNNLAFINLSTFDPTTYYLLLQLRVVVTGILFQIIFKKYLNRRQWISLILLTVGCMMKQIYLGPRSEMENNATSERSGVLAKNMIGFEFSISALLIVAQTIFSCLAGVYNEYLLKDKGSEVNIFVQNVFMYLDSIVCNAVILLIQGGLIDAFTLESLSTVFRLNVVIIMINNAAIGIVTSFFLKYMNSILKTFASALELVFTAILSYLLFSIPIYLNTVLAISIVSFAIYLYSQSPVVNLGKLRSTEFNSGDKEHLLADAELEMEEV